MHISILSQLEKGAKSAFLILPLLKVKDRILFPKEIEKEKKLYDAPILAGDFKGNEGEVSLIYKGSSRVLLLGLGDADSLRVETLRRCFSIALKQALSLKVKEIEVYIPEIPALPEEDVIKGAMEGMLLSNYLFHQLKSDHLKKDRPVPIEKIKLVTQFKNALKIANKALVIAKGVYFARDLVNGNADDVTPSHLASIAKDLAKRHPKVTTTIFDKKRLVKEGFGLLLAVSQGSHQPPVLIVAEYKGNPKSADKTVLVGKGVTYDTGGLNMKPTGGMETMKCDMGGAAAALATLDVAASLGLKQNITVVVPSTENSVSSSSYKPGDVYKSYLGKTVEISNTDAEGRLILADALAYTVKHLKPKRIIDLATLTGACEIALGNETTALFSNNDALADSLLRSGSISFERVWRMPLFDEYKTQLKSEIADLRNQGGRPAGLVTSALFLQEFVGDVPWAHLDIAGTAYISEAKRYHPRFATGIGVRLLTEFLENL